MWRADRALSPARLRLAPGQLASIAGTLARQRALAGPVWRCGLVTLYAVPAGWPAAVLRADEDLPQVGDPAALAEALADSDISAFFIPYDAVLSETLLEARCLKCGQSKTVYVENPCIIRKN